MSKSNPAIIGIRIAAINAIPRSRDLGLYVSKMKSELIFSTLKFIIVILITLLLGQTTNEGFKSLIMDVHHGN